MSNCKRHNLINLVVFMQSMMVEQHIETDSYLLGYGNNGIIKKVYLVFDKKTHF